MKIRQGFVSNSSSSSFVLFVEKKTHEEVLSKMNKIEQGVIRQLEQGIDKFNDIEFIILGEHIVQDFGTWNYVFLNKEDFSEEDIKKFETDGYKSPSEIFDYYQNLIPEDKCLSHDMEM